MKIILEINDWTKEVEISDSLLIGRWIVVDISPPMSVAIRPKHLVTNEKITTVNLFYTGSRNNMPVFKYDG